MQELPGTWLLTQRDNTPDAWAANRQHMLTEAQAERIRTLHEKALLDHLFPPGHYTRWKLGEQALIGLLAFLALNAAPAQPTLFTILFFALGFVFAVAWRSARPLSLPLFKPLILRPLQPLLATIKADVVRDDIALIVAEPAYREIRGDDGVTIELKVPGRRFGVDLALGNSLREVGGRVACAILTSYTPPLLLSAAPLAVANVPSDSQLAQAVGVSDDGEIIYEADLHDDIPDGDMRTLGDG
ncbi:MAG: hypothetical protein IT320_03060 [Anaerolineae bacterium]|nr:hypothetical protein [Anaerolineae bacterium]